VSTTERKWRKASWSRKVKKFVVFDATATDTFALQAINAENLLDENN
jgi:hypothetical protein